MEDSTSKYAKIISDCWYYFINILLGAWISSINY